MSFRDFFRFAWLMCCVLICACGVKEVELPRVEIADGSAHVSLSEPIGTGKGPLLLTDFTSLEDLQEVIEIENLRGVPGIRPGIEVRPRVCVVQRTPECTLRSVLKTGVSQQDFVDARTGGFWSRVWLAIRSPFVVLHRRDLIRVEILARWKYHRFGEGDVAFYNLADAMLHNLRDNDFMSMPSEDLSEKGYINTFNHIIAQALMTTLFSESVADFVADAHERFHMIELVSGEFTEEQISQFEIGPVDNYLDMINNEWGQELGKQLKKKYLINRRTYWTPELLANYLNDIQRYHSWAFEVEFKPFRSSDDLIMRFTDKINKVMEDIGV